MNLTTKKVMDTHSSQGVALVSNVWQPVRRATVHSRDD